MPRKPETNFTHCTRACPAGEHKHYVTGYLLSIRYTLTLNDTHRCTAGTHWHRTETVPAATWLERRFPTRRVGRIG